MSANNGHALTHDEQILLAAHELRANPDAIFTAEELTVKAWQMYPRAFGLCGYSDLYPDSNKVLSGLMGSKGMVRRGLLLREGAKLYSLSREGRNAVRRLLPASNGHADPPAPVVVSWNAKESTHLLGLFEKRAMDLWRDGRKAELSFADAAAFWSLPKESYGDVVERRVQQCGEALNAWLLRCAQWRVTLAGGRFVSTEDIAALRELHSYLQHRFGRHLRLLRERQATAKESRQ